MKIHLKARHFTNSTFFGAVSGLPDGIKMKGDPIQRALLEKFPRASTIHVSVNWCSVDKVKYDMSEYIAALFEKHKELAKSKNSNDILHTIEII